MVHYGMLYIILIFVLFTVFFFINAKKVIGTISGSAFDAHAEPTLKQLKILKFCDIT